MNYAFVLLRLIPLHLVDSLLVLLSKLTYGDLTKYGIQRPKEGPIFLKVSDCKYPVVEIGTVKKIKSGEIQVLPTLKGIKHGGNEVVFEDGKCHQFDSIVFATGFKRLTRLWLQGANSLLNNDGFPKQMRPHHWKGQIGIYFVGLGKQALVGATVDAQKTVDDIFNLVTK